MEKGDDPYEILGVSHNASESDIKKQYRKLALQYHPDRQSTDEDREKANHVFAKLSDAYDTVTDPVKRYDWHQANERRKKKAARTPPPPSRTHQSKTPPRNQAKTVPPPPPRGQGSNGPTTNTARSPPSSSNNRPAGTGRVQHPPPPPRKVPAPSAPHPPNRHQGRSPDSLSSSSHHQRRPSPNRGKSPDPGSLSSSSHHHRRPPPNHGTSPDPGSLSSSSHHQHRTKTYHGKSQDPRSLSSSSHHQRLPSPGGVKESSSKPSSTPGGGQNHLPPPPNRKADTTKPYRDPFAVFDSVMKEEYGDNYKEEEKSGWMSSFGVPGLPSLPNPFKTTMKVGYSAGECSRKEFKKLDLNNDRSLSHDELRKYIESHADLWRMLGMNLNLTVTRCIEVATDVAYMLALGEDISRPKRTRKADHRELSEKEFIHFHQTYVLDASGSHEFFLRTIFAAFDTNGDGVLNRSELDHFLDIFYQARDIFRGSRRLPPKKELLSIVHKRLDTNRDSVLDYGEIRDLLMVAAVVSASSENTMIVGQ